jgi:hypothetical protein
LFRYGLDILMYLYHITKLLMTNFTLWHVDLLLAKDRKTSNYTHSHC